MSLLVIKVGGEILREGQDGRDGVLPAVVADVVELLGRKSRVVMVHGGGPQATAMQQQLGQTAKMVAGQRITDDAALDVMKMVVGGQLNIDLCAALLAGGARPVGLHGVSSLVIEARKRPPRLVTGGGSEPVDFGLVGDVVGIHRPLLDLLLDAGYTPVLACLGADPTGQVLNINADTVANQLASQLGADHLCLVTATPGVLQKVSDESSRIPRLTVAQARAAIADGSVFGGMIPKLEESIQVLETGGVGSVHILGKLKRGDLLREIDAPGSVGTALLP